MISFFCSLSPTLSLLLTADRSWQCTSPLLIFKSLVPFYVIYFLLQFIFICSIPIHLSAFSPDISTFSLSLFLSLLSRPLFFHLCFSSVICPLTQSVALCNGSILRRLPASLTVMVSSDLLTEMFERCITEIFFVIRYFFPCIKNKI